MALHHLPMVLFTVAILAVSAWLLPRIPAEAERIIAVTAPPAAVAAELRVLADGIWWIWVGSLGGFLGFALLSTAVSAWSHHRLRRRLQWMIRCCDDLLSPGAGVLLVPSSGKGPLARLEQRLADLQRELNARQRALDDEVQLHRLRSQLDAGLEMADTPEALDDLLLRTLQEVLPPGGCAEVLLCTDALGQLGPPLTSHAGFGCGVATLDRCPAAHAQRRLVAPDPTSLSACPRLSRPGVCQPFGTEAQVLGVLHLEVPALRSHHEETLDLVALALGARLGGDKLASK